MFVYGPSSHNSLKLPSVFTEQYTPVGDNDDSYGIVAAKERVNNAHGREPAIQLVKTTRLTTIHYDSSLAI